MTKPIGGRESAGMFAGLMLTLLSDLQHLGREIQNDRKMEEPAL